MKEIGYIEAKKLLEKVLETKHLTVQTILNTLFPKKGILDMLKEQEIKPRAGNDDGIPYFLINLSEIETICVEYHNQKLERGE